MNQILHMVLYEPLYRAMGEEIKGKTFIEIAKILTEHSDKIRAYKILIVIAEGVCYNAISDRYNPDHHRVYTSNSDWENVESDVPIVIQYTREMIQEVLDDKQIYELTGREQQVIIEPINMYMVYENMPIPYSLSYKFDFMKKYIDEIYADLSLYNYNFVIAGGIFSYLMGIKPNRGRFVSDVDLFIVANTEEEAHERAKSFYELMQSRNARTYITENCMTFIYQMEFYKFNLQLILRWHNTPEQVIEKFDLAPAMMYAYHGKIYCNAEARFAFTHNCIIANIEKRRNNYSYRIKKYMARNFGVLMYDCVLPEFGTFTLDTMVYTIKQSECNYIKCEIQKINPFSGHVTNYYCSDKIYKPHYIAIDNAQCGESGNISNIAGKVSNIQTFEYEPSFDFTLLIYYLENLKDFTNIMRYIDSKRIFTDEEFQILTTLVSRNQKNKLILIVVRKLREGFAKLLPTYNAKLKHYSEYEASCPLNPCAADYYGEYYKIDGVKLID